MLADSHSPSSNGFETKCRISGSPRTGGQEEVMDERRLSSTPAVRPHVIIVGGGFGGVAAARALKDAPVRVTVIDRSNHFLFQPLLYQVAAGTIPASNVASPIRWVLRKQPNTRVMLAEVTGVDKDKRCVYLNHGDQPLTYDYLVLATGAQGSYFGNDAWAAFAPAMKTLGEAETLRGRLLTSFELAELAEDPRARQELITFVLVGAGPTGCELAGTFAEKIHFADQNGFRRIDPSDARIVLIEAGPRVLPMFSEASSRKALQQLRKMGVEVRLGQAVEHVDEDGVIAAGERIRSKNVIWTAGVTASPVGEYLAADTDQAGRVKVGPDLTVPGHPEIFVVGDTAHIEEDGKMLPGVAQVAMQGGKYAGRSIHARVTGKDVPPFAYADRGNMATIAHNYAVMETGNLQLAGVLAKVGWVYVHLLYLSSMQHRFSTFLQWMWLLIFKSRGSAYIVEPVTATDQPAVGG
jgi:NADH dehydrogenase FAD-containing subunit